MYIFIACDMCMNIDCCIYCSLEVMFTVGNSQLQFHKPNQTAVTPGPVYQVPSTVWDLVWMVEQLYRKLLGKEQAFQFHMQDDEMIAEN